jgi:hypothetical protein
METIRRSFLVDREEINYLRITLEAYDGMAVVRTLDSHEAKIEIMISPGCEEMIYSLLESLRKNEGLNILDCPQES